jgi:DNA-binding transcriptional regulator YdaS (Cro superfamily)
MTFREWAEANPGNLVRVSEESGVSRQTITALAKGMRLDSYKRALAVSKATDGLVTPLELLEGAK